MTMSNSSSPISAISRSIVWLRTAMLDAALWGGWNAVEAVPASLLAT